MKTSRREEQERAGKNEINLMKITNHINVIKYFGDFVYSGDFRFILIEYCEVNLNFYLFILNIK